MNDLALVPKADSTRLWNNVETQKEWRALIVSASVENRKALLRILEGLPVDTFIAATIEQAQEVMSRHSMDVIFCEESLPDGSYRQFLEPATARSKRFVVMLRTGEWDEYLEAMRLGVTDVLRCPLQPIEVELVLVGLGRDRARQDADVKA